MTQDPPSIPIYENYGAYKPKVNAEKAVRRLLDTVPQEQVRGLGSIVLSSQAALPRSQRRKKYWSRGKKISQERILGYYQPGGRGNPAYIELYLDRIFQGSPVLLNRIPVLREAVLGRVLFHEIGHHIHYTSRPEFREREDVADEWGGRLFQIAIRKLYPWVPMLRPLFRAFRAVARQVEKHQSKRRLAKNV